MQNNQLPIINAVEILPADQLVSKSGGSMFRLTRMAMTRALEIHFGKPPLVKHHSSEKETTIALREIAQGKVVLKTK